MIQKILIAKREELIAKGDPLAVSFDVKEINVLSDPNQLRVLKLTVPFLEGYTCATDLFNCANEVINNDNIYKVLEFCMLRNRVLWVHVLKVFPMLVEG